VKRSDLMKRNISLFPEDNLGDALWQMLLAGDCLTQPREVEFSTLFSTDVLALKFGQLLLENNQKLSFTPYQEDSEYPWEITAYPEIAPNYENISAYQNLLEASAKPFNGKYDGWYCLNAHAKAE
jgi:hypothetical protein